MKMRMTWDGLSNATGAACGALLVCGLLGAGPVAADEPDVIITAVRHDSDLAETAAHGTIITAEDIEAGAYQDVAAVLGDVPGIIIRASSPGPATAEISMRGFGENSHGRVLVLVDGFRLNDAHMASASLLQIPIGSIERIEIVRGGSSAMYGNHAVAGVINIITKNGSKESSGSIALEAGSFGTTMVHGEAQGQSGSLLYSVSAESLSSDGYRDQSEYSSLGAGVRLQMDPSETLSIDYALSANLLEYEFPSYLSLEQMNDDPTQSFSEDDHAENEYLETHVRVTAGVGEGKEVETGLSYRRSDLTTDMNSWMSYFDTIMDTVSLTPQFRIDGDVGGMQNNLQIGADLSFDQLEVERFDSEARGLETISATIDRQIAGLYLRDELALTDAWKLSAAVRGETAQVEGEVTDLTGVIVDDDVTHDESALDLALLRSFIGGSKAYVKAGTLYRYPFVDEQISYVGYGADAFYTDLEAEKGWNAELGGSLVPNEIWSLDLSVFQIEMEDEIAYSYMTYRNENLDDTRRTGSEIVLNWKPCKAFDGSLGYTFVDSEFTNGDNNGNEIPLVPQDKVDVTARVHPLLGLLVETRWTQVGDQYLGGDTSNLGPTMDSYGVLDFLVRYRPAAAQQVEVFAAVDNVLDEEYAALGYKGFSEDAYYPASGVAYRGGLSYQF